MQYSNQAKSGPFLKYILEGPKPPSASHTLSPLKDFGPPNKSPICQKMSTNYAGIAKTQV